MYKQKLQELCQQRHWEIPVYAITKEGLDHNPRFRASVTICGATFNSPLNDPSRTSKEAQNEAARVAFLHFVPDAAAPTAPPPPSSSLVQPSRSAIEESTGCGSATNAVTMDDSETHSLYKSRLQSYTLKRNLNMPIYSHVREGSLHAPRFKASVIVDGKTFGSSQSFGTLKDAEHAAAKVAFMSLSASGNQEEDHGFYKNLLQELAQKEGFAIPTYKTVGDGPSHMPTFISTLEIEGEVFQGDVAKTRKQAEMNAAKVAWTRLRGCKSKRTAELSAKFQILNISDAFSSVVPTESSIAGTFKLMCTINGANDRMLADRSGRKTEPAVVHVCSSLPHDRTTVTEELGGNGDNKLTACVQKPSTTVKARHSLSSLSDAANASGRNPFLEGSATSDDDQSAPNGTTTGIPPAPVLPASRDSVQPPVSSPSQDSGRSPADLAWPVGSLRMSPMCNRVFVFPRKLGFQIPPGAKLLPFSDEMWVAVSMEPPGGGSTKV